MMRQQGTLAYLITLLVILLSACGGLLVQSDLQPAADLLPGETVILSKASNLFVKPSEYGLPSLFSGIKGVLDIEAVGGQVHLTNYRLVFKSHDYNRVRGKVSVFLPAIKTIRDASALVTRKVAITTDLTEFEFVIWGIPAFIEAVEHARAALTPDDIARVRTLAVQYYERVGEGLQTFGGQ